MRKINRLNARSAATMNQFGRHADGGGLYLSISPNGGRRWVFLYRWHGKPTEIGFGSAPRAAAPDVPARAGVTLADARELAAQARAQLAKGVNPKDARKPAGFNEGAGVADVAGAVEIDGDGEDLEGGEARGSDCTFAALAREGGEAEGVSGAIGDGEAGEV